MPPREKVESDDMSLVARPLPDIIVDWVGAGIALGAIELLYGFVAGIDGRGLAGIELPGTTLSEVAGAVGGGVEPKEAP
jgi:hypothetical protein